MVEYCSPGGGPGFGAFWNIDFIRNEGLLDNPVWTTLFLGWPGGAWTPPTHDALMYLVNHLPKNTNWNLSVMDPMQWRLHALAIAMGGNVRVGWEDLPTLPDGRLAPTNADLVRVVVEMAKAVGREVATPDEAREIMGLPARKPAAAAAAR